MSVVPRRREIGTDLENIGAFADSSIDMDWNSALGRSHNLW